MQLDPDVAELLETMRSLDVPALSAGTPEAARAGYDDAPKPPPEPMTRVTEAIVPGPAGDIPIRVYAPIDQPDLPVVAFFHGGGWVLSDLDGHDSLARRLAIRSGALVVSVGYRLAPEHPFPAPHDDCWAVTAWLAEHAGEFGGDGSRLAVAGDSAGGNLAAGVALRARDEGLDLAFQLLIYPAIDVDFARPSMIANATGYFLTTEDMQWFWDQFVAPADRTNPYAVPMAAPDVSGLAPALIQTAAFDPLRDEGEAWGHRLHAAGVDVTVTRYDGVVHGFVSRWTQMRRAEDAHAEAGAALRSALSGARRLTDFDTEAASRQWEVVDDDVMGGQSEGRLEIHGTVGNFAGTVVTDGGGFTSIRLPLDLGDLAGTDQITMRVRADHRSYGLIFEDAAVHDGRSVAHRADLLRVGANDGPIDADGWAVVTIRYDELGTFVHGRPIDAPAFDPETATEIAVIIADDTDGDFSLDIDWIDAVPAPHR